MSARVQLAQGGSVQLFANSLIGCKRLAREAVREVAAAAVDGDAFDGARAAREAGRARARPASRAARAPSKASPSTAAAATSRTASLASRLQPIREFANNCTDPPWAN